MTRARVKKFWLCRHGHPMWRKPGTGAWICYTCNDLNLNHTHDATTLCIHGHKKVVGTDCRVCKSHRQTPWLRLLDTEGTAQCPKGHIVSHHDDSVAYVKSRKLKARHCRVCLDGSIAKALSLAPGVSTEPLCRKGLHERTPENTKYNTRGQRQCIACWEVANTRGKTADALNRQHKRGLPRHYVDWVVVERMLSKGTTSYIRRGAHQGPTDGERWVAYCTFVRNAGGRHPEDLYGEPGYEPMQLYQFSAWRGLGKKYKWREVTLNDIRGMIHTPQYLGNILK